LTGCTIQANGDGQCSGSGADGNVAYFFIAAAIMAAIRLVPAPGTDDNRSLYEHVSSDQYPTQYLRQPDFVHQLLAAKATITAATAMGNGNGNGNTISLSPNTQPSRNNWSGNGIGPGQRLLRRCDVKRQCHPERLGERS